MAFQYFKYLTNYGNTIVAVSGSPFTLGPNEGQLFANFDIPAIQPLYLYAVSGGNIIANSDSQINAYLTSIGQQSSQSIFTGYTASTNTRLITIESNVTYLSGQTAARVTNTKFYAYTGATNTRLNTDEANIIYLSGQTAARLKTSDFNVYSANTLTLIQSSQAGLDPKAAVLVATTGALGGGATYISTGGTAGTGQFTSAPTTIDSVTLSIGNRILVKDQVNQKQNGIYTVISSGIWNRSSDMDGSPASEVSAGNYTFVETGNTNVGSGWVVIGNGQLTLNTDPIRWTKFSSIATYTAGVGITISGTSISFNGGSVAGNALTWSGTQLNVNPTGGTLGTKFNTKLDITAFNAYSGSTLTNINTRLLKTDFNTYTGTTAPATYVKVVNFNAYSASTLTNIQARLLTTAFNTYSGNTANLINTKIGSANNGLTKAGTNIHLGGALTGATQIGLGVNSITFTGTTGTLKYGSDLSANYTLRSLVDKGFVTGITSTLLTVSVFNAYSATTLTNINSRLLISAFNTYSGNTANLINTKIGSANNGLTKSGTNVHLGGALTGATQIGMGANSITFTGTTGTLKYGSDLSTNYTVRSIVDKGFVTGITNTLLTISAFNTYSGNTANLINTKIGSANNGLTKAGTNVHLGGALTGATQIGLGANNIIFTGTTGTLRYGSDLSANYNVRSLVDKGFVTGITSTLVATANNGLTKSGQNVHLGGTLTGATTIDASTFTLLETGSTGQFNVQRTTGSINLQSRNAVVLDAKSIAGVDRVTLKLSVTGATFTDARTGTTATGIQYGGDYSANYTKRSIIDQAYYTGHTLYTRSQLLVYASGSTNISVTTPVSLILNRLIRNDSSVFTYTGGTAIKILQAGTYDVSYVINATSSDGILKSVAAEIYKNGVSQVTTTTSGTIGGQTGAGVCLTLSPTEMTFAANDIIQLRGFRLIVPLSGNANTTANGVFISIVKKY